MEQLAEAEARVEHDCFARNARAGGILKPAAERLRYLTSDRFVVRALLHFGGAAGGVHGHKAEARVADDREDAWVEEAARDVVDDVGTLGGGGLGDRGLGGIDGDQCAGLSA